MDSIDLSQEFDRCDFGDARLDQRARAIASVLGEKPNVSIPAAFVSRAEMEACYRFFDNENVTPAKIYEPHFQATYQRMAMHNYVLLVQDTTEIDLTRPHQQVAGAGPMCGESRRGAFFHPMIAFTEGGVPLGLVGQKAWTREALSSGTASQKTEACRKRPIEEKESYRWIGGWHVAQRTAEQCPETTCVCVSDSESDIYQLFVAACEDRPENLHLLCRAGQIRNTTDSQDWLAHVRSQAKLGDKTIRIRAREEKFGKGTTARNRVREGREAVLEIRKDTIQIARPRHGSRKLPAFVTLHVVLCEEQNPPPGEDRISWMLVTTLPIQTDDDVQRVIHSYCVRWQIEVYFRTLKSGCLVEYRRFENLDRVLNCLAFYSIAAWRLMYICHLGRECPEMKCEVIFEPSEWKSVFAVLGKKIPTRGCPTLNEVVRAIATLGGFIDRPKQQPGTQTLWVGLQRCYDLASAWNTFGPGSKNFVRE